MFFNPSKVFKLEICWQSHPCSFCETNIFQSVNKSLKVVNTSLSMTQTLRFNKLNFSTFDFRSSSVLSTKSANWQLSRSELHNLNARIYPTTGGGTPSSGLAATAAVFTPVFFLAPSSAVPGGACDPCNLALFCPPCRACKPWHEVQLCGDAA